MSDFSPAFRDQLAQPLPSLPSAHEIANEIVRRDQRRTRLLAIVCLVFWIAAVSGLVLMVTGLNEFLMGVRLGNARRFLQSSTERTPNASTATLRGQPDSTTTDPGQARDGRQQPDGGDSAYWDDGTGLFHHTLPLIDGSMALLLLAGASTVLLIFSSRRTTLNRINISLAQISEQLRSLSPPATRSASSEVANSTQSGEGPA
jgi:hypothetical protein